MDNLQKALDKVMIQLRHYREDVDTKQAELKNLKAELNLLINRNT